MQWYLRVFEKGKVLQGLSVSLVIGHLCLRGPPQGLMAVGNTYL